MELLQHCGLKYLQIGQRCVESNESDSEGVEGQRLCVRRPAPCRRRCRRCLVVVGLLVAELATGAFLRIFLCNMLLTTLRSP